MQASVLFAFPLEAQLTDWCQTYLIQVFLYQLNLSEDTFTYIPRCVSPRWLQTHSNWQRRLIIVDAHFVITHHLQIIIYVVSRPGASSDFVFSTEQPLLHNALKIIHISRTYMLFKAFIAPTTETYTHTFDLYSFVTPLTFPRFLPSSKYLTSRHPSKYWRNNQGFTFTKYIFEKGNVVFIKTH